MFISFTVNDIHYLSTTYTICQTIANKKKKNNCINLPTICQRLANTWRILFQFGNVWLNLATSTHVGDDFGKNNLTTFANIFNSERFGFDTAEKEPSKIFLYLLTSSPRFRNTKIICKNPWSQNCRILLLYQLVTPLSIFRPFST